MIDRASLTYEGQIHLDFVYDMDKTLETGHRMVMDALHCAPYLDYLLDTKEHWQWLKSTPNHFLVAHDSMLSPVEVKSYFEKLNLCFHECLSDPALHYLGERPPSIVRKVRYLSTSIPIPLSLRS